MAIAPAQRKREERGEEAPGRELDEIGLKPSSKSSGFLRKAAAYTAAAIASLAMGVQAQQVTIKDVTATQQGSNIVFKQGTNVVGQVDKSFVQGIKTEDSILFPNGGAISKSPGSVLTFEQSTNAPAATVGTNAPAALGTNAPATVSTNAPVQAQSDTTVTGGGTLMVPKGGTAKLPSDSEIVGQEGGTTVELPAGTELTVGKVKVKLLKPESRTLQPGHKAKLPKSDKGHEITAGSDMTVELPAADKSELTVPAGSQLKFGPDTEVQTSQAVTLHSAEASAPAQAGAVPTTAPAAAVASTNTVDVAGAWSLDGKGGQHWGVIKLKVDDKGKVTGKGYPNSHITLDNYGQEHAGWDISGQITKDGKPVKGKEGDGFKGSWTGRPGHGDMELTQKGDKISITFSNHGQEYSWTGTKGE